MPSSFPVFFCEDKSVLRYPLLNSLPSGGGTPPQKRRCGPAGPVAALHKPLPVPLCRAHRRFAPPTKPFPVHEIDLPGVRNPKNPISVHNIGLFCVRTSSARSLPLRSAERIVASLLQVSGLFVNNSALRSLSLVSVHFARFFAHGG